MKDETLTPEVVPPTEALVVHQPQAVGILRPAGSLDAIAEAFKEYQRVCETILDGSDYQSYEGKPRKKKSAWRKLATAFNVSTEIMGKEVLRPDGRSVVMAEIRVRASTPGGRQAEALGSCDVNEKCCASSRGQKCHKAAWKGHFCCVNGCDGRKHWSHPDHDIISTAQTRATNRAIADLIGCGEVSAEELDGDNEPPKPQKPQKPAEGVKTPPTPEKPATSPPAHTAPKLATDATRKWWIGEIDKADCREKATQFAIDLAWILPNEKLEEIQLCYVPVSKKETADFFAKMATWSVSGKAVAPYQHEFQPAPPAASPPTPAAKPSKDDEWWRDVIVPIPHKGQKRADYLKHPDTIGSLYDLRHGNDEESQAARQRLWGFVNHFEPKGWTKDNGQQMPPSDGDVKFREALDAFQTWFERNHPDEKL